MHSFGSLTKPLPPTDAHRITQDNYLILFMKITDLIVHYTRLTHLYRPVFKFKSIT